MRHEKYREWLTLSLYGELEPERGRRLERHLETCPACRDELAELREFHEWADEAKIEPGPELLNQARAQFRGALLAERQREGKSAPRGGWFGGWSLWAPPSLLAAFCMLAGLGLGFLLFRSPASPVPQPGSASPSDFRVDNVRWTEAGDGEIELRFDAVRPVTLKGNVDEPRIQKVLSKALLESVNPGLRMRAVGAIGEGQSQVLDREVKAALIQTMRFDENTGVRRRALNALTQTAIDRDTKEAFLQVLLHDENAGLRMAAIAALEAADGKSPGVDPELLRMLEDRLDSEKNDYIRLRTKAFLQEAQYQ